MHRYEGSCVLVVTNRRKLEMDDPVSKHARVVVCVGTQWFSAKAGRQSASLEIRLVGSRYPVGGG